MAWSGPRQDETWASGHVVAVPETDADRDYLRLGRCGGSDAAPDRARLPYRDGTVAVINPLGTILLKFDGALNSSVDSLVGLVSNEVVGPLVVGVVILFVIEGVKTASGDPEPMRKLAPHLAVFGIVLWLVTDPEIYLYYARALLFGLPTRLVSAVSGTGSGLAAATTIPASLDHLWGQVWQASGQVGETASYDLRGLAQVIASFLVAWAAAVALFVCVWAYMTCGLFLTLVIIAGPLLIASWPFPALRHFALAWKGVALSLGLAVVLTFITMQIAILACQSLMVDIATALIQSFTTPGTAAEAVVGLIAMCGVLWTCALAISAVPVVTFFIGRGGSAPATVNLVRS
jgi:hypothetical protein